MCLILASNITFNTVKTALKRIFNVKTKALKDVSNQFQNLTIKQDESVFVIDQNTKLWRKFKKKMMCNL